MKIAMIPARMGSQRLKQKNLRKLNGVILITHAIRKCLAAEIFDEIYVNSEHIAFGDIAEKEGVSYHKRPEELASNEATSEDFVYEFLKNHSCKYLFQVHSIAPLLTINQIKEFVKKIEVEKYDVLLSVVDEQIECAKEGNPINFDFNRKMNSQELVPIQRITWSITGWCRENYLKEYESGKCATYAGKVGFFSIDRLAGHIIKTEEDLLIAEELFKLRKETNKKL